MLLKKIIQNVGSSELKAYCRNATLQHLISPKSGKSFRTPHSAFRTPHSAFRNPPRPSLKGRERTHSTFRIPHFALPTSHSAFRTPHSAFRIPLLLLLLTGLFFACQNPAPNTLFSALPAAETGVQFANTLPEASPEGMNIIQYLYYYNGGGVAAGDLNNDGLTDLYFSANLGPNKLYFNRGNFKFEDLTEKAGVGGSGSWKNGVTLADVNADGWLDIYVCQTGKYKKFEGRNQLFVNNQNGTFTERAAECGLDIQAFATQATFFDYDLDGDLDCFVLCHSVHSPAGYRDTAQSRKYDPLAADRLLRNDATRPGELPRFTDVSQEMGILGGTAGYGLSMAISDFNLDGWPDIYVANDFHENDYLYYNRNGKRFEEQIAGSMGHTSNFSMGSDAADLNNDQRPDLLTLDMKPRDEFTLKASQAADLYDVYLFKHERGYHWQFPRNNFQLNRFNDAQDKAKFSEIAQLCGLDASDWSWSALLFDADLDGWKDVYISNGIPRQPNDMDYLKFISSEAVNNNTPDKALIEKMPSGERRNAAWRQRAALEFEDVAQAWGLDLQGCTNGAAYADLDNDGDLDLITSNLNAPASIYRNNSPETKRIRIELRGPALNPFGIGAKVQVGEQFFEHYITRGFLSCSAPGFCVHADAENTGIQVTWPDGKTSANARAGQNGQVLLDYADAQNTGISKPIPPTPPDWQAFQVPYTHQSSGYNDITQEKLLPWLLSTQALPLSVADVNGDRLDDFVIADSLFMQEVSGNFRPAALPALPGIISASAFFDADGDGDADLYLGTGGNQPGAPLKDYLLRNDGRGNFSLAPEALPDLQEQSACVLPFDYDKDGDLDLFVGGRCVAGAYGMAPRSALLQNDGKGKFSDLTPPELQRIGMVTDALWTGDQLLLCGEWMPLSMARFSGGSWALQTIPNSAGLWLSLHAADVDGDGDLDVLAGNMGSNSFLKAPLGLWVKDFDNNGAFDPILTHRREGREYVLADRDWLLSQMPGLRKKFVEYRKYAESDFDGVFPEKMRAQAQHLEVHTLNSVALIQEKGNWIMLALPMALQFSPVFSSIQLPVNAQETRLLCAGNFCEVQPAIGRFDASYGSFLHYDAAQKAFTTDKPVPPIGYGALQGSVRQMALLRAAKGQVLLTAQHNGPLLAWRNPKLP